MPRIAARYNSVNSRIAFLPFWRGTAHPQSDAAHCSFESVASHPSSTMRCHLSGFMS